MTQEQKENLLNIIKEKADSQKEFKERNKWNEIYWQIVKIQTRDE